MTQEVPIPHQETGVEALPTHSSYELLYLEHRGKLLKKPIQSVDRPDQIEEVATALQKLTEKLVILGVRETTSRRFGVNFEGETIITREENPISKNYWLSYPDAPARFYPPSEASRIQVGEMSALEVAMLRNGGVHPEAVVLASNDDIFPATLGDMIVNIESPRPRIVI